MFHYIIASQNFSTLFLSNYMNIYAYRLVNSIEELGEFWVVPFITAVRGLFLVDVLLITLCYTANLLHTHNYFPRSSLRECLIEFAISSLSDYIGKQLLDSIGKRPTVISRIINYPLIYGLDRVLLSYYCSLRYSILILDLQKFGGNELQLKLKVNLITLFPFKGALSPFVFDKIFLNVSWWWSYHL